MAKTKLLDSLKNMINIENYHPGLSIDCVIFGFKDGNLKVLLNKLDVIDKWMLPGGFMLKEESIDDAATRVLFTRTGLDNVYLKQFHLFGDLDRGVSTAEDNLKILNFLGVDNPRFRSYSRFVSLGFYALLDVTKCEIESLYEDEKVDWYDLKSIPKLYADHNRIIQIAIESIRNQLGFVPIGYELLPDKFTMPELRAIYETIIGRTLDRRNFQRKMLSVGLIKKLDETRKQGAHKAPHLYTFVHEQYQLASEFGLQLMPWNSRDL